MIVSICSNFPMLVISQFYRHICKHVHQILVSNGGDIIYKDSDPCNWFVTVLLDL